MKFTKEDTRHFYSLMWPLHTYTNQTYNLITRTDTVEDYKEQPLEDKVLVRDHTFSNPQIIKDFVKKNPFNFNTEDLKIVAGWVHYIQDVFLIERTLKKHAIFINDKNVFGVLGLNESFQELIPKYALPLCVETALLPFKGKITYDGIFKANQAQIGRGFKGMLKDQYMAAKHDKKIITEIQ